MQDPDESLNAENIKRNLATCYVGQNVVCFASTDSTNRVAKELARNGAAEGTLVIADSQTGGRGRLNRQWLAPAGSSLLMSVIFRPQLTPLQTMRVTMVCSLAIAEAIEELTALRVQLKWPNDIVIGGRKLAGILCELGLQANQLDFVVVGMGVNVNLDFQDELQQYPADNAPDTAQASLRSLPARSTSLSQELGQPLARLHLLHTLLPRIERRYDRLKAGWIPNDEWKQRLETLHHVVTVTSDQQHITGQAEDVDADGALLLRLPDGSVTRILAGDVTLRTSV